MIRRKQYLTGGEKKIKWQKKLTQRVKRKTIRIQNEKMINQNLEYNKY